MTCSITGNVVMSSHLETQSPLTPLHELGVLRVAVILRKKLHKWIRLFIFWLISGGKTAQQIH